MRSWRLLAIILCTLALCLVANAQVAKILIPAGTPEDQAIQAITNESDSQKHAAMWQEFVTKFESNPQALAYGNWQLSQIYNAGGDKAKALQYGDKALAAMPNNIDILVANAGMAQEMKDSAKVMDYALRGGKAYSGIASQQKPEGFTDEQFAAKVNEEKASAQQAYDFLEATAYNVVAAEQNPQKRLTYVEQYTEAFPQSKFSEQVGALAIMAVQNDPAKLNAFAEKILAKNPNSLPTLLLLANAYAEDQSPASAAKAANYAQRAIELANGDAAEADASRKLSSGVAHSALGYALMKQEKNPQAIVEFKTAAPMLKDNPAAYSTVMFRLGYAYVNTKQYAEAKTAFTEAAAIEGPFQTEAKKQLERLATGKPAVRKR